MQDKAKMVELFSRFLDQMGMDGMEMDDYGEMDSGSLPIWSQINASELGQGMGPLHSKESLMRQMDSTPVPVNQYGIPTSSDQEEMMIATGMV
jgi:hypothetical protein